MEESTIPRKLVRRFPPYHEAGNVAESRKAVVTLHREGWSDKSIARYLKVDPPPEAGGVAQEATEQAQERRSWWSRMFGS